MSVPEIQRALQELPRDEKWDVAEWLLEELIERNSVSDDAGVGGPLEQPDYAARRQKLYGDKILPNMVILARGEERW